MFLKLNESDNRWAKNHIPEQTLKKSALGRAKSNSFYRQTLDKRVVACPAQPEKVFVQSALALVAQVRQRRDALQLSGSVSRSSPGDFKKVILSHLGFVSPLSSECWKAAGRVCQNFDKHYPPRLPTHRFACAKNTPYTFFSLSGAKRKDCSGEDSPCRHAPLPRAMVAHC